MHPADEPYDRLAALPRTVWRGALVTGVGTPAHRLAHARAWLDRLQAGQLPPPHADFGDRVASGPLRAVVGELGLPAFCRATPPLAEHVLRSLLWHLDQLADRQPAQDRDTAIAQLAREFHEGWAAQTVGLDEDLQLLLGLGDFAELPWDRLCGQLRSRPWAAVREASELLDQLPALARLVERLGRQARDEPVPPIPAPGSPPPSRERQPLRAVVTRLPGAPGEITGVRFTGRPERMLASEAVMLTHPLLRKLWRARHAEARLLGWDTAAVLTDWRPDPDALTVAPAPASSPEPQARGPVILCLDTSGSMRGAPERIAKAVAVAALRAVRDTGRACLLLAYGGPGEVLEHELGGGEAGLAALLALMDQAFDGGTDIQTPIERAVARVHEARWRAADLLIVSDGEFGCVPATLALLDDARARLGLRVQGVLVGDRETLGLLEVCDAIHWVHDWRRFAEGTAPAERRHAEPPVHSRSLTALYFPNALSARAARHRGTPGNRP
ncbi:MAG: VWA domain-containing protein [Burkholderiales bacterium]|nr:VWA domain-containing protein [Burkholderiales bacterium]